MITDKEYLIDFLESQILDYSDWELKDETYTHMMIGTCIALLKANAPFEVMADKEYNLSHVKIFPRESSVIDEDTFWILFPEIKWYSENDTTAFPFSKMGR